MDEKLNKPEEKIEIPEEKLEDVSGGIVVEWTPIEPPLPYPDLHGNDFFNP